MINYRFKVFLSLLSLHIPLTVFADYDTLLQTSFEYNDPYYEKGLLCSGDTFSYKSKQLAMLPKGSRPSFLIEATDAAKSLSNQDKRLCLGQNIQGYINVMHFKGGTMPKAVAISIDKSFDDVEFLPDRTPYTTEEQSKNAFSELSEYRDGGIYITHYAGFSEWERHLQGDEFVQVLEGKTKLVLLQSDEEQSHTLITGQLFVVPKGTWHRFESPDGVKVLTITPQPTDHSAELPVDSSSKRTT